MLIEQTIKNKGIHSFHKVKVVFYFTADETTQLQEYSFLFTRHPLRLLACNAIISIPISEMFPVSNTCDCQTGRSLLKDKGCWP